MTTVTFTSGFSHVPVFLCELDLLSLKNPSSLLCKRDLTKWTLELGGLGGFISSPPLKGSLAENGIRFWQVFYVCLFSFQYCNYVISGSSYLLRFQLTSLLLDLLELPSLYMIWFSQWREATTLWVTQRDKMGLLSTADLSTPFWIHYLTKTSRIWSPWGLWACPGGGIALKTIPGSPPPNRTQQLRPCMSQHDLASALFQYFSLPSWISETFLLFLSFG